MPRLSRSWQHGTQPFLMSLTGRARQQEGLLAAEEFRQKHPNTSAGQIAASILLQQAPNGPSVTKTTKHAAGPKTIEELMDLNDKLLVELETVREHRLRQPDGCKPSERELELGRLLQESLATIVRRVPPKKLGVTKGARACRERRQSCRRPCAVVPLHLTCVAVLQLSEAFSGYRCGSVAVGGGPTRRDSRRNAGRSKTKGPRGHARRRRQQALTGKRRIRAPCTPAFPQCTKQRRPSHVKCVAASVQSGDERRLPLVASFATVSL